MIPRGTRVKKKLEFFDWEGTVCGEVQLITGERLVVVQMDNRQVFCAQEQHLIVTMGVRITDTPNPQQDRVLPEFIPTKA